MELSARIGIASFQNLHSIKRKLLYTPVRPWRPTMTQGDEDLGAIISSRRLVSPRLEIHQGSKDGVAPRRIGAFRSNNAPKSEDISPVYMRKEDMRPPRYIGHVLIENAKATGEFLSIFRAAAKISNPCRHIGGVLIK